jgi:hypothetical protein
MRRPWLRIRVRTLMIAVAVAATGMGIWNHVEELRTQAFLYSFVAALHRRAETIHTYPQKYDGCCLGCFGPAFKANPRLDPILAVYHGRLHRKYAYAASYPWLPVRPDPPPPE